MDNGRYRKGFDQFIMIYFMIFQYKAGLDTYKSTVYQEISICLDHLHYPWMEIVPL